MSILPQLIANSIIAGATYTLITLGFNLIYGSTKFVNMAHGVVAAVGGYAVFFFAKIHGIPVSLSVAIGMVAAGFVGYLTEKLVYMRLRRRKAKPIVLFIASLGVFTMLQAALAMLFSSQFQTLPQLDVLARTFEIGGAAITAVQLLVLGLAAAVFGAMLLMLRCTIFGKMVRAISDDEEVAKIVGIDTDRVIGQVFFIGSAVAGLAGILIGFDTGIQPTMGLSVLLEGAISSIIGGIGSIHGGVLGSFLLGFVENFGIWKIAAEWKGAISLGLLVVFLVFRPEGIVKK